MNSDPKAGANILVHILFKGQFIIPPFQRPYAWDKKHVKSLLDDIARAINEQRPYYYLGPVSFTSIDNNKFELNDGQQRIATITLICAYLYEHFENVEDAINAKEAMHILFINLPDIHDKNQNIDKLEPRITLSKNDQPAYKSIISGKVNLSQNRKMKAAWKTIKDFFSDIKHSSTKFKKSFFKFILNNIGISWTEHENTEDAAASYVSQNTRGMPLEPIQLTFAYLYQCLKKYETKSQNMEAHLTDMRARFDKNENKLFYYTRHFACCEHGYLPKSNFYLVLSEKINTPNEAYSFIHRLSKRSRIEIFENIDKKSQNEEYYKQLTLDASQTNSIMKITDHIQDLHEHKKNFNVIMFALICQYKDALKGKKKDVAKFVYKSSKMLASFVQRATHSFPNSLSQYEERAASLAHAITKHRCITPKKFLSYLEQNFDPNNTIIPDGPYQKTMESVSFQRDDPNAMNILVRINEHKTKRGLLVRRTQTTVDHILPYSPVHLHGWTDFNEREHEDYKLRLGNLTLLNRKENSSSNDFNANFLKKIDTYKNSEYVITQELHTKQEWNKTHINERQKEFAKIAVIIWNFTIGNQKKGGKKP